MTAAGDDRVIVVTFWKLRTTKLFNSLFPDLADNWIDDMREFYGDAADDHTKTRLPMLTTPDWEHHPTTH
jgi:hypothetical protein